MGWKATYGCGCKENVKEANLLLLNVSLLQVGKHVLKTCGGDANPFLILFLHASWQKEMQAAQASFGQVQNLSKRFPPDLYKKE